MLLDVWYSSFIRFGGGGARPHFLISPAFAVSHWRVPFGTDACVPNPAPPWLEKLWTWCQVNIVLWGNRNEKGQNSQNWLWALDLVSLVLLFFLAFIFMKLQLIDKLIH